MGHVYSEPDIYTSPACVIARQRRLASQHRESDKMPVIHIDGLPYVAPDWLQRRIAHDETRAERWRQQAEPLRHRTDRRLSGVQHLPLYAAKPWFKSLMVCQPIDGRHGATVRGSTAVSGRRPKFPSLYYWRKRIVFISCYRFRPN